MKCVTLVLVVLVGGGPLKVIYWILIFFFTSFLFSAHLIGKLSTCFNDQKGLQHKLMNWRMTVGWEVRTLIVGKEKTFVIHIAWKFVFRGFYLSNVVWPVINHPQSPLILCIIYLTTWTVLIYWTDFWWIAFSWKKKIPKTDQLVVMHLLLTDSRELNLIDISILKEELFPVD